MNLTKALKIKKKLIKNIDENFNRFHIYNSVKEGDEVVYDAQESYTNFIHLTNELIVLKTKIQKANQPIVGKIFEMAELKNQIKKLRGVSTNNSVVKDRYSDSNSKYVATINKLQMDKIIESFEEKIETLQSEIESYNAVTLIG